MCFVVIGRNCFCGCDFGFCVALICLVWVFIGYLVFMFGFYVVMFEIRGWFVFELWVFIIWLVWLHLCCARGVGLIVCTLLIWICGGLFRFCLYLLFVCLFVCLLAFVCLF